MSASSSTERIEQFFHHLASLKEYAKRTMLTGDNLTEEEERDRADRMLEFMEIGGSFDLSEKDMVTILYREMFIRS